jgi:hypothetical protein
MDGLADVARYRFTPLKLLLGIAFALALFSAATSTHAADAETRALVQRLLETQRTNGFILRTKLTVSDTAIEARRVAQIRVKSRREPDVTRLLYEVLWPAADKGNVLSLERSATGSLKGFHLAPGNEIAPITTAALQTRYLDSDLTVEDLIEDFWQWPDATAAGEEQVERELCKIINLRPPSGARSSYSLVRAWISIEKTVPMRIVKFDRSGKPKEFAVQKIMRKDDLWVPVVTRIQTPGSSRHTLFEISGGERDVDIPPQDFSLEKLKRAAAQL